MENENQTTNVVNKTSNKCAIASFVCSLVGLIIFAMPCGIAAAITGIIGLVQINKNKDTQKGMWMAIVGLVLGILDAILGAIAIMAAVVEVLAMM